tara:strand:- start:1240 stop:1464 length:225 start_codon:yes stop_codon:yes gene_type:complete
MPGFKMKDKKKMKMGTQMYGYGGEIKKKKNVAMYKNGGLVPKFGTGGILSKAQKTLPKPLQDEIKKSKKNNMSG